MALLALFSAAPALAHMEGTCLLRLADQAETLRRCQAAQADRDQCDAARIALETAQAECRAQLYTEPDISHAIEHGQSRVSGMAANSPMQKSRDRSARHHQLLQPNQNHLTRMLGLDKQSWFTQMDDYFDEANCPGAFRAHNGRYRLVGTHYFERRPLERDEPAPSSGINWHFYEAMTPDTCIAAPREGDRAPWGQPAIVNVPRDLLLELAHDQKVNRVYLCVTLRDCEAQLVRLKDAHRRYVEHLATYYRLQDCSWTDRVAATLRPTAHAGKPVPFCQQKELDTLLLNERRYLRELEEAVFNTGLLP